MSPRLITQLSSESPRVLIVGEDNTLRRRTELYLIRQGLEIVVLDSLLKKENLGRALSNDFYKIIVIGSGEDLKTNVSNLRSKANILVINLLLSIEPNSYVSSHSDLIVGLDVVPSGNSSWSFYKYVTKNINRGQILDPEIELYLQSEEEFFNSIKREILSPQKKRIVVRGKKHSSAVVISEILRLFSLFNPSKNLQVKVKLKKSFKNKFTSFEKIKTKIEDLPSLLEESVRNTRISNIPLKPEIKNEFHERVLSKPAPKKVEQKQPKKVEIDIPYLNDVYQLPKVIHSSPIKPIIEEKPETIDDKLGNIFKVKRVDQKVKRVKKIAKKTKRIKKTTKKKKILFALGAFFTAIATTMLIFTGIFILSISNLEKEITNVFLEFSQDISEIDYSKIENKSSFLEKQIVVYEQMLPPEVFIDSRNLVEISQKIIEYDSYKKEFKADTDSLVSSILGKDLLEDILSSQKPAKTAQAYYETASRLLSRLNDFKDVQKQDDKKEKIDQFIKFVEKQKSSLLVYQQLSPIFDELFGITEKKTYALVFQNNQELRPTGGFIQAVALLTVDQGMLVDTQVFSSYELDKNLGGSVVPPDEVINLLGENRWYLRDSNWDPDFNNSSKQISWFLGQETNRKIDGVIGINLFVLENILKEIGPLELDEYNEIITDKNIFERSEFHSEIKLVESSEIEDYQSNLLRYLLRDLVIKGQEDPGSVVRALSKSLREKQMTISIEERDISQTLSLLGWSGELVKPQCPNQLSAIPCQVDSLVINEANVGINKANYHTTRKDSHVIDLQKTQVKHTRNITLSNKAFSNAWPKGMYRSYFRVYLPTDTKSVYLKIDGEKLTKDEYKISKENGNLILSVLVETPIKTDKNIELVYVVPIEFSLPYSYTFFNQKQPGTSNILPQVIINYEPSLSPTLIAPQAQVNGNSIIFDKLEEDHAFVGVSFK